MIRQNFVNVKRGIGTVAVLVLMLIPVAVGRTQSKGAPKSDVRINSNLAIRQVVARFSDGWNRHDAPFMCASLADDVLWTSWRGEVFHTRKEVEDSHATLFGDLYKSTHRTDDVKSVTYLRPDLASVDDYWTMTGARARDGSDWPYRAGYANFMMERRGNRWVIVLAHIADFNAKAPEPAK